MKFETTALIATWLLGVAQAAPAHEKGELDCHPVGEAGIIASQDHWTNHYYGHLHYDFKESRLEPTEERKGMPKKKLQFYECKPPTSKLNGTTAQHWFGQLRVADEPSKCVTTTTWWVKTKDTGPYGGPGYTSRPEGNKTETTLKECSTLEETLRLQWFGMTRPSKKNVNAALVHKGYAEDEEAFAICGNEENTDEGKGSYFCRASDMRSNGFYMSMLETKEEKRGESGEDPPAPEWYLGKEDMKKEK